MPLVKVTVKWPDMLNNLRIAEKRIQTFIAAQIQTNRAFLFSQEGAYSGHQKWKALRYRQGMILQLTGTLKRSLAPVSKDGKAPPNGRVDFTGNLNKKTVTIGTSVAYAAIHNFGGPIRRKGKIIGRMPKRNFTDWNKQDNQELADAVGKFVAKVMNGN